MILGEGGVVVVFNILSISVNHASPAWGVGGEQKRSTELEWTRTVSD